MVALTLIPTIGLAVLGQRHGRRRGQSTTAGNEVRQLRMGLGHILDYTSTLHRRGHTVQPVLHVEREPADAQRWLDITARTRGLLTWPGTETGLSLPTLRSRRSCIPIR